MATAAGVGTSHHRDPRVAGRQAAERALAEAGIDRPDFVFMGATAGYEQSAVVRAVREACGNAPLTGCSVEGTLGDGEPDESGFSVTVLTLRSQEVSFSHGLAQGLQKDSYAAGSGIGHMIGSRLSAARMLFLFPDGLTANNDRLLRGLEEALPGDWSLPVVGGAAGDSHQYARTYQYCDDSVVSDGAAWALLAGEVGVLWGVNHGCVPIGVEHTVTRAEGNTIYEIDGRPVVDVFQEYLTSEEMEDWLTAIVSLPFGFEAPSGMDGYDRYLVRVVLSRDETKGSVTVPTEVEPGTQVRIMRRDYDKVIAGVDGLAAQLSERLGGRTPGVIFQFECAGRGKAFLRKEPQHRLLQRLQVQLPVAPWFGLYTYGELGPVGGRNYFHNYTVVLAALC
ncbi:FIST signal transduction protein [Streptomyces sp. NPDC048362]|uniref:FIST signal transduction protein n=1 Tax=Streptomyces sp. NPDC048362 TaxID=3365539 RepID=UPI003718A394